jgi:hypothetical protein
LLLLLNYAFLVEKQHIQLSLSLDWPTWGSNARSTTLEEVADVVHHEN